MTWVIEMGVKQRSEPPSPVNLLQLVGNGTPLYRPPDREADYICQRFITQLNVLALCLEFLEDCQLVRGYFVYY